MYGIASGVENAVVVLVNKDESNHDKVEPVLSWRFFLFNLAEWGGQLSKASSYTKFLRQTQIFITPTISRPKQSAFDSENSYEYNELYIALRSKGRKGDIIVAVLKKTVRNKAGKNEYLPKSSKL